MLTGHYPFSSSEDPAYRQGSFKFRGSGCSGRAEELLAGLIKRRWGGFCGHETGDGLGLFLCQVKKLFFGGIVDGNIF